MQVPNSTPQQQSPDNTPTLLTNEEMKRRAAAPPAMEEAPPAPEAAPVELPPEVAALNSYMQETYGVDFQTAMSYIQQAQPAAQAEPPQVDIDAQINQLKTFWKVDDTGMAERMQIVAAELEKIPEVQRPMYDSVEGAQLLWQRYEMNKPPALDRPSLSGTSSGGGSQYMYTRTQLHNMSEADLRAQDQRILYAEANGQVYEDLV